MSCPIHRPICIKCIHLNLKEIKDGKPVCKAYPNGIPYDVWKEKCKTDNDMIMICPNGYRFSKKEGVSNV